MAEDNTPTSPVLKGREGLTIPAKEDRMLEIKWADYWNKNGGEWGVQVHSTYTAEVVDGFYQFKADNPDIPDWWFPRDFMDGQQLTQRAFVGWGVTQEDIDNLKEGFEKGIFDKEKDKKLLEVVNDLDGSDNLIKSIDTPTNVVDDIDNDLSIKNQVDAPNAIQKYSMKGLDFLGKAVAPIDEALEIGIPKLLADTAAAPFAQSLVKVFRQLTLVNLGIAATKGLYEAKVMGENYENLLKDPNNPEYIAERDRLNQAGIQAFSEHMSTYDPSIRFIDKVTEEKFGFNQTDAAIKVYGGIRNLFGGRK